MGAHLVQDTLDDLVGEVELRHDEELVVEGDGSSVERKGLGARDLQR